MSTEIEPGWRDLAALVVSSNDEGLLVDGEALMPDDNHPRYWQLVVEHHGLWTHPPSGVTAPLGEHLWCIAMTYLNMGADR